MKPLEVRKYLYDISEACRLLEEFTEGRSFDDYRADALLRSAVERQFGIIGEALNKAISKDPDLAAEITGSSRIVAFRNRLIHGYASVSNEVVWGVLESNLPSLRREVDELLADDSGDS